MNKFSKASADLADIAKDNPLSRSKARARKAGTREVAAGKAKDGAGKKKQNPGKAGTAKKVKRSNAYRRHTRTTESEDSEGGDSPAPQIFLEGDLGFEEAFQASRRGRHQVRDTGRAPQGPPRPGPRAPTTSVNRRRSHYQVSDSELLGDMEDDTLAPPTRPPYTVAAPQVSALPTHPTNTPVPLPRQNRNISAITGRPFAGPHRHPEALSGYGDSPMHRRGTSARDPRVAPSTSVGITEDSNGRATVTRTSNAAMLGLPVAQAHRPPQSFYAPAPDGSHRHYPDGSGTPSFATRPEPSSRSRMGFTPNQRAHRHAQTNVQPPIPAESAQPVGPSCHCLVSNLLSYATDTDTSRQATRAPANTPTGQRDPTSNGLANPLTEEVARHNDALFEERRRRERWPRDELGRHARAIRDILGAEEDDWAAGFLERENERERREAQGSSDDD